MNLGLRDVAALADAIAGKESFRNLGDTVLLRRYERSRREDIRALMVATDGLQRLFAVPETAREGRAQRGHGLRRRAAAREALARISRARLIDRTFGRFAGRTRFRYGVHCAVHTD